MEIFSGTGSDFDFYGEKKSHGSFSVNKKVFQNELDLDLFSIVDSPILEYYLSDERPGLCEPSFFPLSPPDLCLLRNLGGRS